MRALGTTTDLASVVLRIDGVPRALEAQLAQAIDDLTAPLATSPEALAAPKGVECPPRGDINFCKSLAKCTHVLAAVDAGGPGLRWGLQTVAEARPLWEAINDYAAAQMLVDTVDEGLF